MVKVWRGPNADFKSLAEIVPQRRLPNDRSSLIEVSMFGPNRQFCDNTRAPKKYQV